MYKRILIAIDGTELANRGLQEGLKLAQVTGAKIDLVTVSEPWSIGMYDAMGWSVGYEASDEYRNEREQNAQNILQPALQTAAEAGIPAEPHHVLDHYAAEGILLAAKENHAELIVMSSHGRRGMSRVLLGSQTVEVLTGSNVPVLVVR